MQIIWIRYIVFPVHYSAISTVNEITTNEVKHTSIENICLGNSETSETNNSERIGLPPKIGAHTNDRICMHIRQCLRIIAKRTFAGIMICSIINRSRSERFCVMLLVILSVLVNRLVNSGFIAAAASDFPNLYLMNVPRSWFVCFASKIDCFILQKCLESIPIRVLKIDG